jgi:hypothetical protein
MKTFTRGMLMKIQARLVPGLCCRAMRIVMIAVTGCIFCQGGCFSGATALAFEKPFHYDTLIITNVVLKNAELEDDNTDNVAAYNAVRAQMIQAYSTAIEKYVTSRNLFKTVVISDNADDARTYENALVLQTRFDKIVLGNRTKRAVRYLFVGIPVFGRGIMKIEAKGRLLDGKSGKVLATEKYDANTSWDASSLEDNLLKMTRNIAHDCAGFIEDKITSGDPITSTDSDSWE